MELRAVESSNIAAIGYDEPKQTLRVQFKSGATYDYTGVPAAVHAGLLASETKGGYLARHIKPVYAATKAETTQDTKGEQIMSARVRAKFRCTSVLSPAWKDAAGRQVNFMAVYGDGTGNESWSEATPSAQLSMYITNPQAYEQFEEGKDYYLDFTPVPAEQG